MSNFERLTKSIQEYIDLKVYELIHENKTFALSSSLSKVATTGLYDDLLRKPNILDIESIKKELAEVASTGEYSDLNGLPDIPNAENILDAVLKSITISAVGKSGKYGDLIDAPNYDYQITEINKRIENLQTGTGIEEIQYISPTAFEEFVDMISDGGIFYVLSTNISIEYEEETYSIIGLYDIRIDSNGINCFGFNKLHQILINPDTKEITNFTSLTKYIIDKIPSNASKLNIVDQEDNFTSDNVEGALNEVSEQLDNIANELANGNIGNNVEPQLMDMPRIYFSEGALPTTKDATTLKFDYYSKTTEYHGWAEIKCQGNSSMGYPKKNFTIKLYKDKEKTQKLKINFKGWGAQSKFVLKANWIDISHARNIVSARIWADIVKSRTGYANLPELLRTSPNQGAVDGFPVTVYGNGYYQGRYTLNIPKDKWMSNMDDSLDTHCILCGENYASGCFRATANINGGDWTDELHDTVPASIKTRWNECISFVMNSTDEEFKANLHNYFDVDSLTDYLLYGIESCGFDAFGKNQIYFTYDGQKWIASMYDMDSTWGLWWNGNSFVATDYPRESFEDFNGSGREGNLLYIRLQKLFVNEIKARYAELKQTIFTYPYLVNKFEEFAQICPLDIVKEDYASTTANGAYTAIPSRTTNNIQQIRNYIKARLDYSDSYINSLVESIPCTGITLNSNDLVFEHSTTAQTLTATLTPSNTSDSVVWSVSPEGIATVENGVVTPISNGSCVITATCGTQSASCNVSVNIDVQDISVTALSLDKDSMNLGILEVSDGENLLIGKNFNLVDRSTVDYVSDEITIGKGLYEVSNINNGDFTWLTLLCEKNGKYNQVYTGKNSTNSFTYAVLSDTNVKVKLAKTSSSTATVDSTNISFKKINDITIVNTTQPFTRLNTTSLVGNNSGVHETSNIVTLDSSKNYIISSHIDYLLDKALCIKVNNNENYYWNNLTDCAVLKPIILNATSIQVSCPIEFGLSNIDLVEVNVSDVGTHIVYDSSILTATLTPSNATNQNVTWTADNENVELISDGLSCTVKGKAVGNSVVTCTSQDTTNGTISDSCNVTVSSTEGGGETDTELVYRLTEATTFNGVDDYIDTGIQLFDTAKDFAILIDCTSDTSQINNATIFHCIHEVQPWRGLNFARINSSDIYRFNGNSGVGNYTGELTGTGKYLIQFVSGKMNSIKTITDGTVSNLTLSIAGEYLQVTENLILGAYQTTDGTKGRFWKGTINQFKVWFKQLTDDEISNLLA